MRRFPTLLVSAALSVASVPAASPTAEARVPEKTPKRLLEATVRRTITGSAAKAATPGVMVVRGGRTLLDINASTPLAPASLLKLAITLVAMEKLGPDHRFATKAAGARPVAGVVAGSLALIGGGDPTLATAAYRAERFIGKPKPDDPHPIPAFAGGSPTIEDLAEGIRAAGVVRVTGNLVVDDFLFDDRRTQPGWIPDYIGRDPEVGYLHALTINEGFSDPEAKGLLRDPALTAGDALRSALRSRGVTVAGRVVRGAASKTAPVIASVESPRLREIIFYINKWSVNLPAELLLKQLGASFGGAGTTVAGAAVVKRALAEHEIPTAGIVLADGSGLSLSNRMPPATIAAILDRILTLPGAGGEALRTSLPVAGGPGTLFKRMRNTPAAGNLRGKTGTIRRVRALAGWVTPLDGVPVVYVLVFNDVSRPSLLTSPLDLLGISLTRYPSP